MWEESWSHTGREVHASWEFDFLGVSGAYFWRIKKEEKIKEGISAKRNRLGYRGLKGHGMDWRFMTTAHRSPNFPRGFLLCIGLPGPWNSWHPVFSSGFLNNFFFPHLPCTHSICSFSRNLWFDLLPIYFWLNVPLPFPSPPCLFHEMLPSFSLLLWFWLYVLSSQCSWSRWGEAAAQGGSQPGLSSMETFWGRRALTQACADTVRDRPGGSPALSPRLPSALLHSSLPGRHPALPRGLCLTDLEGRWLTLSPGQRRGSGWSRSHCPESCLWPQEMPPHGRAHLHLESEIQRGIAASLPLCLSTAPRVWGTSHRRSTELGSHDPQAPSCEHEGQSPSLRKKDMSLRPVVPWGSGVPEPKGLIALH